jgi:hypothetical protein
MRTAAIAAMASSLTGCDWAWTFAKEMAIAPTGRYGWSGFTFEGKLPANFGIKAIVFYGPVDHNQSRCRTRTLEIDQTVARRKVDAYEATISKEPQTFSFDIPLTYSVGFCSMELDRIDLRIRGSFGEKDWQTTYSDGGFSIVRELRPSTPAFDERGNLEINSLCKWMFQESKMHLQLDKMLACKGAGAYLQRDQLSGKTVSMTINVSKEESPSHDDTWIKFENGWRPCAITKEWRWCREPIEFKTFKMNGKTCTIYPGCTE